MTKAIYLIAFLYGILLASFFVVARYEIATNKQTIIVMGSMGFILLFVQFCIGLNSLIKHEGDDLDCEDCGNYINKSFENVNCNGCSRNPFYINCYTSK